MGSITINTPVNVYVTCGCCDKKHECHKNHKWHDDSIVVTEVQPEDCDVCAQPEDDSIEQ